MLIATSKSQSLGSEKKSTKCKFKIKESLLMRLKNVQSRSKKVFAQISKIKISRMTRLSNRFGLDL
jgi:hypothetical protein